MAALEAEVSPTAPVAQRVSSEHRHVTWLELFYDLVYVVAIAILATQLSQNVSVEGVLVFVGLLIPVWWSWAGFTIFGSRFGRDDSFERGMTLLQMFAAGAMAIQLPLALTAGSAGFVLAYVATRATLLVLYVRARSYFSEARELNTALLSGYSLGAALWLISLAFPPPIRFAFWGAGIAVEFATFLLARRISRRFPVNTEHLPERFGLFTIIVLGEGILAILLSIADVNWNPLAVLAASLGFALIAAIWWNYYGYVDRAPLQCTLGSGHGYTFLHLPMVAGLAATAVGIEHVVVDAAEGVAHPETLYLLGGGLATWVLSFFALQVLTYPFAERRRLTATYGLGIVGIAPLAWGASVLHHVALLAVFAGVLVAVALSESGRRAAIPARAYAGVAAKKAAPKRSEPPREYRGEGIVVRFDPEVCVHAAECLRRLPEVFDLRNRPWVDPDGAPVPTVMETIATCPSGALTYELVEETES